MIMCFKWLSNILNTKAISTITAFLLMMQFLYFLLIILFLLSSETITILLFMMFIQVLKQLITNNNYNTGGKTTPKLITKEIFHSIRDILVVNDSNQRSGVLVFISFIALNRMYLNLLTIS